MIKNGTKRKKKKKKKRLFGLSILQTCRPLMLFFFVPISGVLDHDAIVGETANG